MTCFQIIQHSTTTVFFPLCEISLSTCNTVTHSHFTAKLWIALLCFCVFCQWRWYSSKHLIVLYTYDNDKLETLFTMKSNTFVLVYQEHEYQHETWWLV